MEGKSFSRVECGDVSNENVDGTGDFARPETLGDAPDPGPATPEALYGEPCLPTAEPCVVGVVENDGTSGEVGGEKGSLIPMVSTPPLDIVVSDFVRVISPVGESFESGREFDIFFSESVLTLRAPILVGGLVEGGNPNSLSPPSGTTASEVPRDDRGWFSSEAE